MPALVTFHVEPHLSIRRCVRKVQWIERSASPREFLDTGAKTFCMPHGQSPKPWSLKKSPVHKWIQDRASFNAGSLLLQHPLSMDMI